MSNPYGRNGKVGFVVSTLSIPVLGVIVCAYVAPGPGIALIIVGIALFVLSLLTVFKK